MKKLFSLTGVFIGIYLVYIFVIYSSSLIFPMNIGNLYDCAVEKNISSEDLIDIAQEYNLTVFTTEYNNTSLLQKDVVFNYLNISDNDDIEMGYQNTLFSTNKILYKEDLESGLKLQRFWTIENEDSNFAGFIDGLKNYGIHNEIFESHRMNFSVIFSQKNVEFFLCVILLLVFCVSVYYMLRSKEIAILKLNGRKDLSISTNIIKIAAIRILMGYTLISIIFGVYLILKHHELLADFSKLYFSTTICIVLTMLAVMLIGTLFVKFLNIVPALKSNKNNKLLVIFTVVFKLCATIILVIFAQNVYYDVLNVQVASETDNSVRSSDFYYVKTAEIPDNVLMDLLLLNFDETDKNKIYNYANPTDCLYGHEASFNHDKKEGMITNPPIIRMSYNMLDFIPVYSDKGERIDQDSFDCNSTTILIPSNLSERTEEIAAGFGENTTVKVRFIESGQEHCNFLNPVEKTYNAIYFLKPIERDIYFNNGRVLFHKDIITDMEKYLSENKIDSGTATLVNLSSDYQKVLGNLDLKLIDDLQFLIVNALSFLLSVIAIGVVYCEFRKKEIAVFKILSVFPKRLVLYLCGINMLITLIVTLCICPVFFFVAILESIVYMAIFYNYQTKKTVSILKGE